MPIIGLRRMPPWQSEPSETFAANNCNNGTRRHRVEMGTWSFSMGDEAVGVELKDHHLHLSAGVLKSDQLILLQMFHAALKIRDFHLIKIVKKINCLAILSL
ncbi:hypothetical protein Nepgr_026958 [Nepenthes gracilis]|uniref:Uncharacterized protein n=1 Tax=Nepenthes gracilis TaxID=150966 RepID=A0AAD3T7T7_NEPGR|nr:hypothetical protein Nepgr_026958 [Nepenthes gracilis]